MRYGLIALIQSYQSLIRPWLGPNCRFYPSCSDYAIAALRGYHLLPASWLISQRLLKCHSFSAGGLDPLPLDCNNPPYE
ncbi:MAG: membrane protein insertion efficiency factor YidD [Candidatus Symbiodolus clandestinus]